MSGTDPSPWRVVFMGTPDFAVPALEALHHDPRFDVALVVSQPSRPAGRGKRLTAPPVAAWAEAHGRPLLQVDKVREAEAVARLADAAPDFLVVIAFGQILPQALLDVPALAPINVHASLLPRWRGAAPIQRSIEAGDAKTGVQIMRMEAGLDTGPIYATAEVAIQAETTGGDLHDTLAQAGAALLPDTLAAIAKGLQPVAQAAEGITWARKLSATDRPVHWDRDAFAVARHINAMSPWPGARAEHGGEQIQVLRAREAASAFPEVSGPPGTILQADSKHGLVVRCAADTAVEILEVQRPGKKPMPATTWLAGARLRVGAPWG